MTTIVAVKKYNRLCIASDTLTLFGSRKEVAKEHVDDNGKIISIGHNFVGIAGHPSWELILSHYFSRKKKIPQWKTADQVFEVFNSFHQHLIENYFLIPTSSHAIPLECSEFEFLMINSHGIFEIDYTRVVRHHLYFSSMGTGEEYALGAIRAVYDRIESPEEIARIGIEAAIEYDKKTGSPIITHCIDSPR